MKNPYKTAAGLTLIEIMITVAIIAILAAVAWPMYQSQSIKNKRSDAIGALTSAWQAMIQDRSDTGRFDANALNSYLPLAPNAPVVDCKSNRGYQIGGNFQSCEGYYTITVDVPNADAFTLTATPTGGWVDPDCTTLTIDQNRVKGSTGTAPVERCWSN